PHSGRYPARAEVQDFRPWHREERATRGHVCGSPCDAAGKAERRGAGGGKEFCGESGTEVLKLGRREPSRLEPRCENVNEGPGGDVREPAHREYRRIVAPRRVENVPGQPLEQYAAHRPREPADPGD